MSTTETLGIKRQATLFKKAHQLSVLCDAEVAVIAFTRDGKLHEFSSTTMDHTLSRYKGKAEQSRPRQRRRHEPVKLEEPKPCDESYFNVDELKEQHAALSLEKSRRMGRELDGLSREELCALEEQQLLALLAVNDKKKELILEMLQRVERPYLTSQVFGMKSEAVSVDNSPSEDSDVHSELLQLRL